MPCGWVYGEIGDRIYQTAATARNLAKGIGSLFWIAVGAACFSGLSGILLSFYLDTPAGATIILISCLLFLLSWIRQRVSG